MMKTQDLVKKSDKFPFGLLSFGAKYAGERTGIVYNDLMDDFSTPGQDNYFGFPASEANYIQPGKRPMSSMSPIIVTDKDRNVRLILGASGGSKIISSVSQVATRTLWTNKPIYEAINERRVHHQLYPFDLEIEKGFSPASGTFINSVIQKFQNS